MEWLDNTIEWWNGHWRRVIYSFLAGAIVALVVG